MRFRPHYRGRSSHSFTLACRNCGKYLWEFYWEPDDPSVGFIGGATKEFDQEACPKCGEDAPDEDTASEWQAQEERDAYEDACERRADEQREDAYATEREVDWESKR